jgi:superfamily I DNA/RNA helicase
MPLCNNANAELGGLQLEEERRLCYVAMTRAV